ncbi:MAG: oligoendopeptidase F [Planctomyces sp.]|nr:oligoendopeptidase F [Planctomyces sp.]
MPVPSSPSQASAPTAFLETWELDSLLPKLGTPGFQEALKNAKGVLESLVAKLAQAPTLEPAQAATWRDLLQQFEELETTLSDLRSHVECYCAGDATNPQYQRIEAELAALAPLREQISTEIELAFRDLTDSGLVEFVNSDPWIAERAYAWQLRRRAARMRLPEAEENLANQLAVDGLHAWGRLYDRISGALKIQLLEEGKVVGKSCSQVQFDSPDRSERQSNFFAADVAWKSIENLCAESLNHIAGTRLSIYAKLGVEDHMVSPLVWNRMSRATLDQMWKVITEKKAVMLRYLRAKATLLGVDKLAWYDLTAPLPRLPGQAPEKLSYAAACQQVVDAFTAFSPDLAAFTKMSLADGWVEAVNRPGKRQGAFCTGYRAAGQSRIFMTFTETADSMSTLAHELGHAYHSYVLKDTPYLLADYPMNLAETASTFAEAVLAEHRMTLAEKPYDKLCQLDASLADGVAFLMNIHARFIFEDNFHKARRNGELSADQLSELMVAAQKEAYLDALAEDGWNPRFWASKLHFYFTGIPFYNFPYTFGYLLSLGLFAEGKSRGEAFAKDFVKLLECSGSMDAEAAVKSSFGFDLSEPDFWSRSIDVLAAKVDEFEKLTAQVTAG